MSNLKIGDKVRFLSDVGGGIVSGFQPGNIVLVEDEDGFQIPAPMSEVVAVDTNKFNFVKRESSVKKPEKPVTQKDDTIVNKTEKKEQEVLQGSEYLASKTVAKENEEDSEVDEQLEAKVTRLEMQIQKLELRILALENKAYRRKTHY
jgi:hypothetical protein